MIYLDNGATSFPKPRAVINAITAALSVAGNPGRSSHAAARLAAKSVEVARLEIANFLGVHKPERIIFQPSATQAANLLLCGSLKSGDRVCLSSVEHNAVTRPLSRLAARGISVERIPCSQTGIINLDAVRQELDTNPPTLLICQHGSNVSGAIQPIEELTKIAHQAGTKILVDGSQVVGHRPILLDELQVDAWFCSGHKGLPGPQGIGLLYKRDDFNPAALIAGGTGMGSSSWDEACIAEPECFEAGTQAFPLILGLAAAAAWLMEETEANKLSAPRMRITEINEHERSLIRHLHVGLSEMPGVTVLGPETDVERLPLVSFVAEQLSADTIADHLDKDYDIAVRPGLHCAPDAHETLGTLATGAVRLSLNYANTLEEIDVALDAIATILEQQKRSNQL